jgi:hypothetical protein
MEIMAEQFPGAFSGYKLEVYFDLYLGKQSVIAYFVLCCSIED